MSNRRRASPPRAMPGNGAHRATPGSVRLTRRGRAVLFASCLSVVALVGWMAWPGSGHHATAAPAEAIGSGSSARQPVSTAGSSSARPRARSTRHAKVDSVDGPEQARAAIASLIAAAPAGGVSVAVENLTTGATFSAGATSGMVCASTAKVEILESALLQNDGPLIGAADEQAEQMIENSDNDAADDLYAEIGAATQFAAYLTRLGLSSRETVPGPPYYWGLTTTSAMQHLILLRNLVSSKSPLTAASQAYMLNLMRNVEADQRWGVPEIADAGTTAANKNGWLNITNDNNLWAVNSDGVVTVQGQQLLMSVFTQHDPDMATGQQLVSKLVRAAATAVLP